MSPIKTILFQFRLFVNNVLGGRPMLCLGYYFTDAIAGDSVYKFVDKFGRIWMATGKWSKFRVEINK